MAEKVKVQDGVIVYSAADPSQALQFGVAGQLNVSNELNVGTSPAQGGIVSTPANSDLLVSSGRDLFIHQGTTGGLYLNNVKWPTGGVTPVPGMYVGVTTTNALEYHSFIIGSEASNTLTMAQLNTNYPSAQPGQSVFGPAVIYTCIATSQWRIIATTTPA